MQLAGLSIAVQTLHAPLLVSAVLKKITASQIFHKHYLRHKLGF